MSRWAGLRSTEPRWPLRMAAAAVIGLTLTGCARIPEPGSPSPRGEMPQVVIGVGTDGGSAVVARLYAGILAARGTDVRLDLDQRQRQRSLSDLDAGALTLVPESMGDLVDHLEPLWRLEIPDADAEETFVELSRALPIGLSVGDFAESATLPVVELEPERVDTIVLEPEPVDTVEPGPERPNNVVPLFRTGELDSDQILALNVIAGELTTADLEMMLEQIDSGRTIGEVTGSWLAERS